MIGTAVDAPGDAPSRPLMEPSEEVMTSVPNCSTPPFLGSFLMICTRWPAVIAPSPRRWPREVLPQRLHLGGAALEDLVDEVLHQAQIVLGRRPASE